MNYGDKIDRIEYLIRRSQIVLNQLDILGSYNSIYTQSDTRYYLKYALVASVIIDISKLFDNKSEVSVNRVLNSYLKDRRLYYKDITNVERIRVLQLAISSRKGLINSVFKYRNNLVAHNDYDKLGRQCIEDYNLGVNELKSLMNITVEALSVLVYVLKEVSV